MYTVQSRGRNTIINFVVVQISGAEAPEAKPMHQSYAKSNLMSLQLSDKWHFGQDKERNGCLVASAQCYEEWVEGSDMLLFIAASVYHQDIAAALLICCTWKSCTQWWGVSVWFMHSVTNGYQTLRLHRLAKHKTAIKKKKALSHFLSAACDQDHI